MAVGTYRRAAARLVTGDAEIDRALEKIKTSVANKIVRSAVTRAARAIVKGIKSEVPAPYKDAKRAIGFSYKKNRKTGITAMKIGAGVGKKLQKGKPRPEGRLGISSRTIHWFILGTAERTRKTMGGIFAGSKSTNLGTGKMSPVLAGIVKSGFSKTNSAALSAMRQEIAAGIRQTASGSKGR